MATTGALDCGDGIRESGGGAADPAAAACCEFTICELSTSEDLDVTFDNNVTDCGACDVNCEALRGNTYRLVYNGAGGLGAGWYYRDGTLLVFVLCNQSGGTDYLFIRAAKDAIPITEACFTNGLLTDVATDLPQTINSSYIIGACCIGTIRAHSGQATIAVA